MVQVRIINGWSRRLYLYGGGLTPKLPDLIKRTFRGVHLLAYLKHEELMQLAGPKTSRARRRTPGPCSMRRSGPTMSRRRELFVGCHRAALFAHRVDRAPATRGQSLTISFLHLTDQRKSIGAPDRGRPPWFWNDRCG